LAAAHVVPRLLLFAWSRHVIRWERQEDGGWHGFSGELLVATVAQDEEDVGRWLWAVPAVKRPKGWQKPAGHRAAWLDARRAADDYWERWLGAAALKPDLEGLARQSVKRETPRKPRKA
jgi:hypothetical protein